MPLWTLLVAVPLGLYPLVRTGLKDLIHERKIGTEIFVTVATVIAMISGEYVAAPVLMTIILIAEFIADMNTDRARASISALMPGEQGVGYHDGPDRCQHAPTERPGLRGEADALVVGEPDPAGTGAARATPGSPLANSR